LVAVEGAVVIEEIVLVRSHGAEQHTISRVEEDAPADPWELPPGPIREALGDAVERELRNRAAADDGNESAGRHRARRKRWRQIVGAGGRYTQP
jgi:hypothetical protein